MGAVLQEITVDENPALISEELVAIDVDELEEARRDHRVHGFLEEARAYGTRLEQEGRTDV